MIIHVANPIYDSVFKYLMEDERIARTILSALLKKEVVEVQIRRNEYTNGYRDNISMFRIDFGARIREADGALRLILIELQKTWLETETLRFRQYLGAQYANPENMVHEEMRPPYGIPILVHDSIIVQIPLLHGQINNRLFKVLSVFDQTNKEKDNRQLVELDEANYQDDADMQYILHRLIMASGDAQLRQDMNVEDEYFQAIEDRDTAIMSRDKMIKEKDQQLSQKDQQLSQKDQQLSQKDQQLSQQSQQLNRIREKLRKQGLSEDEIAEMFGK